MAIAELEFERDPTLRTMRKYDKINPELEGYEPVISRRDGFSGRAYWASDDEDRTVSFVALADLENDSLD